MTSLADLKALAERCERKTHWSQDWNMLRSVLASDGSGAHIAIAATPDYAAFIAAASPDRLLALVAVAQAAQELSEPFGGEEGWEVIPRAPLFALREALAALGGER